MNKYLLLLTSLTAMTMTAQPPTVSKTVTTSLGHSGVPVPTGLAGNADSNGVNLT